MNSEICLTCLEKPSKAHSLNEIILENLKISDVLHQLVPLLLEKQDLTLPNIICVECLKDLVIAYKFQKKCLDSIQNLQELFSKSSLNNETSKNESYEFTSCNDEDIKMSFDEISVESYALTSDTSVFLEQNDDMSKEETSNDTTEALTTNEHEESSNNLLENVGAQTAADSSSACNQCKICKRKFKQPQGLASHMSKTHLKKHVYKCQKCKRGFHAEDPFIRHCNRHLGLKPFSCSQCNKSFITNTQLNSHKRSHSKEQTYTCNVCDKQFYRIDVYRLHTKRHHDVKFFNCLKCGKTFESFSDHYKHLQIHKNEKCLADDISKISDIHKDRKNAFEKILIDPVYTAHIEVKSEKMDDEEVPLDNAREVNTKQKEETRAESNKEEWNTNVKAESPQCDICNIVFKNDHGLAIHRSTAHFKNYSFQCDQCDKKFNVEELYIKHQNSHLGIKNFKCNQCGKVFKTNGMLNQHLISHSDSSPNLCTICGKGFRRIDSLRQHMRRHGEGRPFKCSECPKAFKCLSDKITHTLTHDQKRFECNVCGKCLKSSKSLSQHVITHTGENPKKCKHCDKSFCSLFKLKCHERIHTGEKPFQCEYCLKSFSQNSTRKRHMNNVH